MVTRRPLAERFWEKVATGPGCWEWQNATTGFGYGVFQLGRGEGTKGAHIVAWELENGPITNGMWVLHHCDNPPCVRPSHLYLGTAEDNGADVSARGRARSAKATHCPANHSYDEANTYIEKATGKRRCRACLKEQKHQRYLDPTKSR